MKKLSLICVVLLLSACGGSDNGNAGDGGSNPVPTPTPSPMVDAFFTRVLEVVGTSPDDAEPIDVMGFAVTDPETTEPPPL